MVVKRTLTKKKKDTIKKKHPECVYCKCNNELYLEIDHKIPLSRGGTNDKSNLQVTCTLCNKLKDNMTHVEFKDYLKALKLLKKINCFNLQYGSPTLNFPRKSDMSISSRTTFNEQVKLDNIALSKLQSGVKEDDNA